MAVWSRNEKLTAFGIIVAVIGVLAALAVVPEIRQVLRLDGKSPHAVNEIPSPTPSATPRLHAPINPAPSPTKKVFTGARLVSTPTPKRQDVPPPRQPEPVRQQNSFPSQVVKNEEVNPRLRGVWIDKSRTTPWYLEFFPQGRVSVGGETTRYVVANFHWEMWGNTLRIDVKPVDDNEGRSPAGLRLEYQGIIKGDIIEGTARDYDSNGELFPWKLERITK
jgi:hypothetical protein